MALVRADIKAYFYFRGVLLLNGVRGLLFPTALYLMLTPLPNILSSLAGRKDEKVSENYFGGPTD